MKRILVLLTVAAIFAAAMAVSAISAGAAPNCAKVGDNNKNCVTSTAGPGGSENAPGAASTKNPNVRTTTTFNPGAAGD